MVNRSILFTGALLAVSSSLLVVGAGCGDDTSETTTGTGTTGSGGSPTTTGTGGSPTTTGTGGSPTTTGTGGAGTGGDATTTTGTGGAGTGGAGTGGAGTGGAAAATCADYCTDIMANCTGDNQQYTDQASCEAACADLDQGAAGDQSGNTLECRAYHAGVAASNAEVHCPHAGPLGTGGCGDDPCEAFCQIAMAECPDAYASEGACNAACMGYEPGTYNTGATGGDTLACRMYHLNVATNVPDPHCGHVGEVSDTCN